MRSIWKGSISFGLVNIPVGVCGAVEANQVSFNQIHKSCNHRIKYQKYCPHCDKGVLPDELIHLSTFSSILMKILQQRVDFLNHSRRIEQ